MISHGLKRTLLVALLGLLGSVGGFPSSAEELPREADSAVVAQHGGILRAQLRGDPPSLSLLEEATLNTVWPAMPLMNNLVRYAADAPVQSLETVEGELATDWRWSADGTQLHFRLRQGVSWHNGGHVYSADVAHTWSLLLGQKAGLRRNPRRAWYRFVREVRTQGPYVVTFVLERPQPSLLALLASGYAPVYPKHVSPAQMRTHPIGSGPFLFHEYRPGESIVLRRNPYYWKPQRPFLEGIRYEIVPSRATRMLALASGLHDIGFPQDITPALRKDLLARNSQLITVLKPGNVFTNLLLNPAHPPLDEPDLRRALSLALDRQIFSNTLSEGIDLVSGPLMPPPHGIWGLPAERRAQLPGYGDPAAARAEARRLLAAHGYNAQNPLRLKVIVRNVGFYLDAAALLIEQLRHVHVHATLERVESVSWYTRIGKGGYAVAMNLTGVAVDDPDALFYENFACDSERNYTRYCNPQLEALMHAQSQELDFTRRRALVWRIEQALLRDAARPVLGHLRAYMAWGPHVRGMRLHQSAYNSWRMETVWLARPRKEGGIAK